MREIKTFDGAMRQMLQDVAIRNAWQVGSQPVEQEGASRSKAQIVEGRGSLAKGVEPHAVVRVLTQTVADQRAEVALVVDGYDSGRFEVRFSRQGSREREHQPSREFAGLFARSDGGQVAVRVAEAMTVQPVFFAVGEHSVEIQKSSFAGGCQDPIVATANDNLPTDLFHAARR